MNEWTQRSFNEFCICVFDYKMTACLIILSSQYFQNPDKCWQKQTKYHLPAQLVKNQPNLATLTAWHRTKLQNKLLALASSYFFAVGGSWL